MDLIPAPEGYAIKLVRDRTPGMINATGEPGELFYGACPPDRVDEFLKLKLGEEVTEFLVWPGRKELR